MFNANLTGIKLIDIVKNNVLLRPDELDYYEVEKLNKNEEMKKLIFSLYKNYCEYSGDDNQNLIKDMLLSIENKILNYKTPYAVDEEWIDLSFFYNLVVPFANKKAHEGIILRSHFYTYLYALNIAKIKGVCDGGDVERKDIKKYENIILKGRIPKYIYLFARDIKHADINKLQEGLLSCRFGNGFDFDSFLFLIYFACDVKGADIKKIQQKIIDSNKETYIYSFARNVEGADIKKLEELILKCGNHRLQYEFARDVEGADIKKIEKLILECNDHDIPYCFARDVKGADIKKIQQRILKTDDLTIMPESFYKNYYEKIYTYEQYKTLFFETGRKRNLTYCYIFARDVKGADIKVLEQAIIDSKNPELCLKFACDVKGADIKSLEQVIIDNNNPELCLKFVREVEGADIEAHRNAIFNSGNVECMLNFVKDIVGINLDISPDDISKSVKKLERRKKTM